MQLLGVLKLFTRSGSPTGTASVAAGAVYYDSSKAEPRYYNGSTWTGFGTPGFPDPNTDFVVPDGRQVTYFDRFTNDGVLTITGSGVLVGIR